MFFTHALGAGFPVLRKVEVAGGKGRGHELKDRQGDAAGVDLFEDLADRFTCRIGPQFNGWYFELLEGKPHGVFKLHQED